MGNFTGHSEFTIAWLCIHAAKINWGLTNKFLCRLTNYLQFRKHWIRIADFVGKWTELIGALEMELKEYRNKKTPSANGALADEVKANANQ